MFRVGLHQKFTLSSGVIFFACWHALACSGMFCPLRRLRSREWFKTSNGFVHGKVQYSSRLALLRATAFYQGILALLGRRGWPRNHRYTMQDSPTSPARWNRGSFCRVSKNKISTEKAKLFSLAPPKLAILAFPFRKDTRSKTFIPESGRLA